MRSKLVAAGVAIALLHGNAAMAQYYKWLPGTPLTNEDRAIITNTVQQQIHGKPVGTVAGWKNPASGHFGSVALLSKYVRQAMPCERIEYQIKSLKPSEPPHRYVLKSCQLADGTWKFAE
jgi:surface antigen